MPLSKNRVVSETKIGNGKPAAAEVGRDDEAAVICSSQPWL